MAPNGKDDTEQLTVADLAANVRATLYELAIDGNVGAARIFLQWADGKSKQRTDIGLTEAELEDVNNQEVDQLLRYQLQIAETLLAEREQLRQEAQGTTTTSSECDS